MERIIDIANYIFNEYKEMSGEVIDEMKLHKLLYFAQRESLAVTGEPLFKESFEGWKFGPVSPVVRSAYSKEGIQSKVLLEVSAESAYIVNNVLAQYGSIESWKLSEMSHNESSWLNTRKGLNEDEHGDRKMKLSDIRKDSEKIRPYDSLYDMYYDEFDDAEAKQ